MPLVVNLAGAVAVLLLGWILGAIAGRLVRVLTRRSHLDERISSAVAAPGSHTPFRLDRLLAGLAFWVVFLLGIVAALNVLNLTTVSEPLNRFLNQIFSFLPQLGAAIFLAFLAWLLASLARTAVRGVTGRFALDERLLPAGEAPGGAGAETAPAAQAAPVVGVTLANAVYWLILLFFLPLILQTLNLGDQLTPLLNLVNDFMAALPRLVKAGAIGVVGWFIARTVRILVSNLLAATGVDRMGDGLGLDPERPGQSLSALAGTVAYVLILIPTATAALEALAIPALSGPAITMLEQILRALPQIFTAAAILVAGVLVGRFVAQLVTRLLAGFGFDRVLGWLGMESPASGATADAGAEAVSSRSGRSPSELMGTLSLGGVVLFAAVAAANVLGLPALSEIVSGLLLLFGRVISGLAVFAVGLGLANWASQLIRSSSTQQASLLAQLARIAILVFAAAMGLQQIGLATSIVNLAFGLVLGAICLAGAVAFGLGGRQAAAEQLQEWRAAWRRQG
jgi:hypothetical protein